MALYEQDADANGLPRHGKPAWLQAVNAFLRQAQLSRDTRASDALDSVRPRHSGDRPCSARGRVRHGEHLVQFRRTFAWVKAQPRWSRWLGESGIRLLMSGLAVARPPSHPEQERPLWARWCRGRDARTAGSRTSQATTQSPVTSTNQMSFCSAGSWSTLNRSPGRSVPRSTSSIAS